MHVLRLCSVFEVPSHSDLEKLAGFDPIGGMQNHTGELTRALATRSVQQTVITAYRPGVEKRVRSPHLDIRRVGIRIRRFRQLYGCAAVRHIAALARHSEIVHVHQGEDLATIPLGLLARRLAKVPLVVTFHCSIGHTVVPRGASQRLVKALGSRLEPLGVRRAGAVIVLTSRMRSMLVNQGVPPARLHRIPSGINETLFDVARDDPLPDLRRPRVLFVGRLVHQKNPHILIRAARLIDERAEIVIVGDGPERSRLQEEITNAGLDERVHLTGFVPHDEIPSYLSHADVFALPSQYEELGSVLIEAMRAGLPVVAADTGGIPEIVEAGQSGILVPPADAPALARATNRLLADRTLAENLGNEGRRRSERYRWSDLAGEVLNIYESLTA